MVRRLPLFAILFFTVLIVSVAVSAAAGPRPLVPAPLQTLPPDRGNDYIPIGLTISGGISLGSYEAGVNWALIEYLAGSVRENPEPGYRNPRLTAVSGASAGTINAVMSALIWCIDRDRLKGNPGLNLIDENLIRDSWLAVGIDELLPQEENLYKDPPKELVDGLFSREAFKVAVDKLEKMLEKPVFRADCGIPIGIALTRTKPVTVTVKKAKVATERFVMSLQLVSRPGGFVEFRTLRTPKAVFSTMPLSGR